MEMREEDAGGAGQVEDQQEEIQSAAIDVAAEVAMIRELVYTAHPDVVRELLVGETLAEILASIEPARAAYLRIAERIEQDRHLKLHPGRLPVAEASTTPVPDQTTLTTTERLRLGVRERAGFTQ